jgi:hypothetical protein
MTTSERKMSEGQRAYEAKRAAKAGVSLERWLALKEKEAQAERSAADKAAAERARAAEPPKKPGFFSRLLEKAQKPL